MSEKREFPILNGKLLSDLDLNGHKLLGLTIPGDRYKFTTVMGEDKLVNKAHNLVLSPSMSETKWTLGYEGEYGIMYDYVLSPELFRINENNFLIIDPFYDSRFDERPRFCAVDADNNALTFADISRVPDGAIHFSTKPLLGEWDFVGYAPITSFRMFIQQVVDGQIIHETHNSMSFSFKNSNGEEVSFTSKIYIYEMISEGSKYLNLWVESDDFMYAGGCELGDTLPDEGELIEFDIYHNETGDMYHIKTTMPNMDEMYIRHVDVSAVCFFAGNVGSDDLMLGSFLGIERMVRIEMAVDDINSGDGYYSFDGVDFDSVTGALKFLDGMYGRVYPIFPNFVRMVNEWRTLEGIELYQEPGNETYMSFERWGYESSMSLTGVAIEKGGIILTPPDSVDDKPRDFNVVIQDAGGSLNFKNTLTISKTNADLNATVGATNVFRITEPIEGMFVVEKIAGQKTAEIDAALVALLIKPVTDMTEDEKNLVIQRCAEILGGKK